MSIAPSTEFTSENIHSHMLSKSTSKTPEYWNTQDPELQYVSPHVNPCIEHRPNVQQLTPGDQNNGPYTSYTITPPSDFVNTPTVTPPVGQVNASYLPSYLTHTSQWDLNASLGDATYYAPIIDEDHYNLADNSNEPKQWYPTINYPTIPYPNEDDASRAYEEMVLDAPEADNYVVSLVNAP